MKKKKKEAKIAIIIIMVALVGIAAIFFLTAYFEKVSREKYSKSATNVEIEVERCIKERQEKPKYFKNRYYLEVKFDIEGERYETSIVFEDERIYKYEEAIEKETYVDGYEFEVFYEEGNPDEVYIYAKLEEKSGNRYYSVITDRKSVV